MANSYDYPPIVRNAISHFWREGEAGIRWAWTWASQQVRDEVDRVLVHQGHDLALRPGTQEQRFLFIVKELANDAENLARAVKEGLMTLDDALLRHLEAILGQLEARLFVGLKLAVEYANLGQWDVVLKLPAAQMTVAQAIEKFGLKPFIGESR